eukprot:TRINITY_DN2094_c1_g3_i1.p1 TRINITY_DN2094_c1_g3~~TRINITY_DN2094_c1_g3_i1.p1  ORF type:complete len:692 (+),score=162.48 TRINITY_DN2094_c1_g3_i1:93-2168(+)
MCGICALLSAPAGGRVVLAPDAALPPPRGPAPRGCFADVKAAVSRRGPDAFREAAVLDGGGVLCGAVLHMRGAGAVTPQPHGRQPVLLAWNGEVFAGLGVTPQGTPLDNDTVLVYDALARAVAAAESWDARDAAVRDVLGALHGPYAFMLALPGALYFGRDPLGRRSLLWGRSDADILLTSVGPSTPLDAALSEVPTGGVYRLNWRPARGTPDVAVAIASIPWAHAIPHAPQGEGGAGPDAAVGEYLEALRRAVEKRVVFACGLSEDEARGGGDAAPTGSRIGVLFSGGVDCAVLAALADDLVPPGESIDLLNVAFGPTPDRTPDRITGRHGWHELARRSPSRKWNFIEIDFTVEGLLRAAPHLASLMAPADTVMDVNIAAALWHGARGVGRRASAADLAAIAATPPPPSLYRQAATADAPPAAPSDPFDALAQAVRAETAGRGGYVSLSDLTKAHRLPYREAGFKKAKDFVAAAARKGLVVTAGAGNGLRVGLPGSRADPLPAPVPEVVRSSARALLVGMGADETLGGYARYRKCWESGGAAALAAEMEGDFARLWRRNLGRDDRVISDHGREARFPFLDEDVLAALAALPLASVCDMTLPLGCGEKRIVREAARRLGLPGAASLQKRAIQFGTRLAHPKVDGTTPLPRDGLVDALAACHGATPSPKRPLPDPSLHDARAAKHPCTRPPP